MENKHLSIYKLPPLEKIDAYDEIAMIDDITIKIIYRPKLPLPVNIEVELSDYEI